MVKKKSKKKIITINSLFKKKIDLPKFNISPSEILKKTSGKIDNFYKDLKKKREIEKRRSEKIRVLNEKKEEQRQKRTIKTRGDITGGTGGWRHHKVKPKATNNEKKLDETANVVEFVVREVNVPETITVAELAHKMAFKGSEVIKVLMNMGQMVTQKSYGRLGGAVNLSFEVADLPEGSYVLRIKAGEKVAAKKVILSQ